VRVGGRTPGVVGVWHDAAVPTHVALLRGINLGPHKRVAMPALRALAESLGHTDVATYIASGNLVFTAGGTRSSDSAERSDRDTGSDLVPPSGTADPGPELERAIAGELGVECRVVVRTCAELARTVADNPYPDEPDPKRVHAFFLVDEPGPAAREHVARAQERAAAKGSRDEAAIVGRVLYLHTPDGFGRSELAAELSKGGRRNPAEGTARNWATVTKLLAMCDG
jgi:uncharacterized protein (DUF1697 family)